MYEFLINTLSTIWGKQKMDVFGLFLCRWPWSLSVFHRMSVFCESYVHLHANVLVFFKLFLLRRLSVFSFCVIDPKYSMQSVCSQHSLSLFFLFGFSWHLFHFSSSRCFSCILFFALYVLQPLLLLLLLWRLLLCISIVISQLNNFHESDIL